MFSFNELDDFDGHIRQSIPNYDLLFDSVVNMAKYFVSPKTSVIDLGCSSGKMLNAIEHDSTKIGVDVAENLMPKSYGLTNFVNQDITEFDSYSNSSLVTSIFTLQFMPRGVRQKIIQRVYDGLIEGGAFIWAEKVYAETPIEQEIMTFTHYDFKRKSFTAEQILSKEKDLRTLMRPNSSLDNQVIAGRAGFKNEGFMFWKFFNFEAWVYIK